CSQTATNWSFAPSTDRRSSSVTWVAGSRRTFRWFASPPRAAATRVVLEDLAHLLKDGGGLTEFPEGANLARTTMAPLPPGRTGTGGLLAVALEQGANTRVAEGTDLVGMLAGQATLAVERAQAQRDREMLFVLEDLCRIGRDPR